MSNATTNKKNKSGESTFQHLLFGIANESTLLEKCLVFSSDLFHRKKVDTATCIITAILGYNEHI